MAAQHSESIDLSHIKLNYALSAASGYRLVRYGLPDHDPWIRYRVAPFALYAHDRNIIQSNDGLERVAMSATDLPDGSRHTVVSMKTLPDCLEIEDHTVVYTGTSLVERWQLIRNAGTKSVRIDRTDSFCLDVPRKSYTLVFFESGWGQEFVGSRVQLEERQVLESRSGRSSNGMVPWFALIGPDGQIFSGTVMWSGNWVIRFEPESDAYRISGGLHDWQFYKGLRPGGVMQTPHVALVLGAKGALNEISAQYADIGRRFWYPRSPLADSLPVEWNHWWSYEDRDLDEAAVRKNVEIAATMGIELCTVDAGWFGPASSEANWFEYRGDWNTINVARFPGGLRKLADDIHQLGMRFGLWCEIEALGSRSQLLQAHSDFAAIRNGTSLGYVCFGNPRAREWAYATLDRIINDYTADWIKLDFNLDPGAGCNRVDHGHDEGDGLFEHYQGLYEMLGRIRGQHPEVVLENCASGGLRTDLGLVRQTHLTFLSDPDWPEHSLQVFWGASCFLAPEVLLHWSYSYWIGDHPRQKFEPRDPNLTQQQVDFYLRVAMLHACGFSQRLPEFPEWVKSRFVWHIGIYKTLVRRFVQSAHVLRLTEQPSDTKDGNYWVGFQYCMPDNREHLVFVFRLPGAASERTLQISGLSADETYVLSRPGEEGSIRSRGSDLLSEGICIRDLAEGTSALILIQQVHHGTTLHG